MITRYFKRFVIVLSLLIIQGFQYVYCQIENKEFKQLIGFYNSDTTVHYNSQATCIVKSGAGTYEIAGDIQGNIYTFTSNWSGDKSNFRTYKLTTVPTPNGWIITQIRDMKKYDTSYVLVGDGERGSGMGIVVIIANSNGSFNKGKFIYKSDCDMYGTSVIRTTDGNFLIGGYYWYTAQSEYRGFVVKLSSSLGLVWKKDYKMNTNYKRNKILLVYERYQSDYMLIGESSINLGDSPFLFIINVNPLSGNITTPKLAYNIGTKITPSGIVKDIFGGYTITSSVRNGGPEKMHIFRIDSVCSKYFSFNPQSSTIGSSVDYDGNKSFTQLTDKTYLLTGLSSSMNENGQINASLAWIDTVPHLKKGIIYGLKNNSLIKLSGLSGSFDIDCPKDSIGEAMLAGYLSGESFLIKPGLGINSLDKGDSQYFWCSQLKPTFSVSCMPINSQSISPTTSNPTVNTPESLIATQFSIILGSCNMCNNDCIDEYGNIKPNEFKTNNSCKCKDLIKKYP